MNYDLIFKIGSLLIGALGAWKLIVEFLRGRHGHLRDEYKFARDFFNDLDKNPNMHPFLKQKGYQAVAGDARLSAGEIEYLLTLQESARALKDFVMGRQYIEHLSTATGSQLTFKPKYQSRFSRLWRKLGYIALYAICYFTAFAPAVLHGFNFMPTQQAVVAIIFTATIFIPAGYFSLKAGVRIARAEALIKSQHKHALPIVVSPRRP